MSKFSNKTSSRDYLSLTNKSQISLETIANFGKLILSPFQSVDDHSIMCSCFMWRTLPFVMLCKLVQPTSCAVNYAVQAGSVNLLKVKLSSALV